LPDWLTQRRRGLLMLLPGAAVLLLLLAVLPDVKLPGSGVKQ
jgi:hypothetical protein